MSNTCRDSGMLEVGALPTGHSDPFDRILPCTSAV